MSTLDASAERRTLRALFAALEDPERAAALDPEGLVVSVARRHRLTPLLSIRCRGFLPDGLAQVCRRDHVLTVARDLALSCVAEECIGAFTAAGVEVAVLKGLAYERTLYAQSGARPTSDVDLLVRDRDRRAAFGVLDRLGFEPRAAAPGFDDADYHEVAWRRHDVEIDLHMGLAPFARCAIDYDEVWRDTRTSPFGATQLRVLAPSHAAIFHALHMAIDHFDVPALYLADLALLLPSPTTTVAAEETARAWRCERPLQSALALARSFQPKWAAEQPTDRAPWPAGRIIASFGDLGSLPRAEQLVRKYAHFDSLTDAIRYTIVQGHRNVAELFEGRVRRRSARARLGL